MRSEESQQIVLDDLCSVCLSRVHTDNEGARKEFLCFVSLVAVYHTVLYICMYKIRQTLKYDFYILSTGHKILLFNCSVIINLELKPCCETIHPLINQMTRAAPVIQNILLILLVLNVTVLLIKAKLIQTTHTRRKSRCTWEKVLDQHDVGHVFTSHTSLFRPSMKCGCLSFSFQSFNTEYRKYEFHLLEEIIKFVFSEEPETVIILVRLICLSFSPFIVSPVK